MRKLLAGLGLLLAGCEAPTGGPSPAAGDRELGVLEAVYPHYSDQGTWWLEYRLSRDTIYVDYEAARALAADPAWKQALTRSEDVFYDNGEGCMYARSLTGCLGFADSPDAGPPAGGGPSTDPGPAGG